MKIVFPLFWWRGTVRIPAAVAILILTATAHAQERDQSLGPWFGAHFTSASAMSVSGTFPAYSFGFSTNTMTGGGIMIGFGFTRWLSAFATMDLANGTASTDTGSSGPPVTGSIALDQVDAGIRLQVPVHRFTPYALVAYSSRVLDDEQTIGGGGLGHYTVWGNGVTYGAGLEFFFSRSWAVDVSWQQTSGSFDHIRLSNGHAYSTSAGSSDDSRFLAGVDWHAGPQTTRTSAVDTKTPLETGQEVRVHAGTLTVAGTVTTIGRDTLIVQRMVNDAPVQSAVPIACIARIERRREPREMTSDLINGSVLGALAGAMAGAIANGQQQNSAKNNGPFFATYFLGGAVIGGGIAAGINALSDRWEPAPPLPVPETTAADRAALCASWYPTQ